MSRERQALQHLFELVEAGIPPSAETLAQCRAALEPERFTDLTALTISNAVADPATWTLHQTIHKAISHLADVVEKGGRRIRLQVLSDLHLIIELEK